MNVLFLLLLKEFPLSKHKSEYHVTRNQELKQLFAVANLSFKIKAAMLLQVARAPLNKEWVK